METETIADIYMSQGYVDYAVKLYEKLLEAQPDNPRLREKVLSALGARSGRGPESRNGLDEIGFLEQLLERVRKTKAERG